MIELAEIAPSFGFILEKGLVASASDYHPERFGNADLLMVGAPFSLQFLRDRGEVFVDVGSTTAGWHKLEDVLEFLDQTITQQQLGSPPNPREMSKALQQNWEQVVALFGDRQRILALEAFGKERSAALIRKLFPEI